MLTIEISHFKMFLIDGCRSIFDGVNIIQFIIHLHTYVLSLATPCYVGM